MDKLIITLLIGVASGMVYSEDRAVVSPILYGNIKFTATILASPCTLIMENQDQSVDLGTWSAANIKNTGQIASPTLFKLQLNHCLAGAYSQQHILRHLDDYRDDSLSISFNGIPALQNDNQLFANLGSAQGVALQISDIQGNKIQPWQAYHYPYTSQTTVHEFVFQSQAIALSLPIVAGSMQSIVGIEISYQ